MALASESKRYKELVSFLDRLPMTSCPEGVDESFRSLWRRIQGEGGMSVSVGRRSGAGTVEIASSVKTGTDEGKGRIEVFSPSSVKPAVEMKIEEKKVTFKAAGEKERETVRAKEDAAKLMIELQKKGAPIKGIGGDAARLFEKVRRVAVLYREQDYIKARKLAGLLMERLDNVEFKTSISQYLVKKVDEYSQIGADVTEPKNQLDDMMKDLPAQDDFHQKAGNINRMLEDSIKGIITESVDVEIVEAEVVAEAESPETMVTAVTEEKPKPKKTITRRVVKRSVKSKKEAPPPSVEKEPQVKTEEKEGEIPKPETIPQPQMDEPKPIIKIVKKKLVPVEEEHSDQSVVPEEKEKTVSTSSNVQVEEEKEEKVVSTTSKVQVEEESVSPSVDVESPKVAVKKTTLKVVKKQEDSVQEKQEPESAVSKSTVSPDNAGVKSDTPKVGGKAETGGISADEIKEAFERLQVIYNAALKLHKSGKDVSQIFEMIKMAEEASGNGNHRMYVGISKQCESMLIKMQ